MKNNILFIFFAMMFLVTSCGGNEEASVTDTDVQHENKSGSNLMENLIEQSMDEALEQVSKQMADTSSILNEMVDTLSEVIKENEDEIQEVMEKEVNRALKEHF